MVARVTFNVEGMPVEGERKKGVRQEYEKKRQNIHRNEKKRKSTDKK